MDDILPVPLGREGGGLSSQWQRLVYKQSTATVLKRRKHEKFSEHFRKAANSKKLLRTINETCSFSREQRKFSTNLSFRPKILAKLKLEKPH